MVKLPGGVTKSGATSLLDIHVYAAPVTTKGFVFMDARLYARQTHQE
jgi:altronate dehydratase